MEIYLVQCFSPTKQYMATQQWQKRKTKSPKRNNNLMKRFWKTTLRGPWGENNRAGISWISNCGC